jgi:arylsulfatase A-like enzyme
MKVRPIGLAVAATLLAAGCSGTKDAGVVVLITLDTTRADRLGCYGYEKAATPNLDALAASGVRFEDATAAVPVTLPSHATMFTGTYPAEHGVRFNGMFKLPDAAETVAEIFGAAGWATAAVPAAYPVATTTGIGQGFAEYRDLFAESEAESLPIHTERSAQNVTDLGLEIVGKHRGKKLFLWLHYFDPHFPYKPPFPFSAEYRDRPYDGEIAYMDREIGRFLEGLKQAGRWEEAAVVVAGDHGEGLYDHGEKMHSNLVYQSTIHVPLIVRAAGNAKARVVKEPVSLVDVFPTLLRLGGLTPPERKDAVDLRGVADGGELPRRALHFESLAGSLVFGWSPLEGVRRGEWKFTQSSEPELYDVGADPGEATNRFASDRSVADDLDAVLRSDLARFQAAGEGAASTSAPMDQETMDRLASLGYVGGTVSAQARGGPHPKRFVHLEGEILSGRDLMTAKEYAAALGIWETVLREDPRNVFALQQGTIAARETGNVDTALTYAQRLAEATPDLLEATIFLGEAWVAKRDFEKAAEIFRGALEKHPDDSGLTYRLALAEIGRGRGEEAIALLEKLLAKPDAAPSIWVARGAARALQGNATAGLDDLKAAIAKGYDDREVLRSEPMLEPLRRLPGFDAIVASIPTKKKTS